MPVPAFLVSEATLLANGTSDSITLTESVPLLVTLGILDVVEQESLLLSLEASADNVVWSTVAVFPEKFYPGVSAIFFDAAVGSMKYLRAQWKVNRWGRGDKSPKFRLYVFVEPLQTAEPLHETTPTR